MENLVVIREAQKSDHPFIFELSPYLAEVAQLDWHSDETIHKMQNDYISKMLEETAKPNITFILQKCLAVLLNIRLYIFILSQLDSLGPVLCSKECNYSLIESYLCLGPLSVCLPILLFRSFTQI